MSPAAVSRFLNRKLELPEESASRIRTAIQELDYRPDATARNLTRGSTQVLGLVVPDVRNPFFAALAEAVEGAAHSSGYRVLLCNSGDDLDRELGYLDLLGHRMVDGLLLLSNHANESSIADAVNRYRNVVVLDEDIPATNVPKVFAHNEVGGWLATRHLLERGHTRIAHVGGPEGLFSAEQRQSGFLRAMREAGVAVEPELVLHGPYTYAFGQDAYRRLEAAGMTAAFSASDYVAVGMLNAASRAGRSVPHDLSIVGFDDMFFAGMLQPPLTTIHQPVEALARAGVQFLLDTLTARSDTVPAPAVMDVELVVRGSVSDLTHSASQAHRRSEHA